MTVTDRRIFREASAILTETYGDGASFREGQYEAIEATMLRHRTLVVQKTGWGKSLVYFICTKMNRNHERGMTMVVSPLLVLMDNQMEFAESMGLCCAALNNSVKGGDRSEVLRRIRENRMDMLFITPETLMKEEIRNALPAFRIGLFVIDEAHCISDWGHDFRLEYGQLGRVISGFFSNVPVLATTATANDRVVADLQKQLGGDVYISRGPLSRPSLHIQMLNLERKADRYAWLMENLPKLPGTGIIYCITRADCEHLAAFLRGNGISALPYHSGKEQDEQNNEAIEAFHENRIKAIVATVKLGMGYDKGDISFVIHYQSPSGIVAWYQQIGRAGRNIPDAYIYLMRGAEDDEINQYFIKTAFPSPEESTEVMAAIENGNGITMRELEQQVNFRQTRIKNAVKFLENERFVRSETVQTGGRKATRYYPTTNRFVYNREHYEAIKAIRMRELEQMHQLHQTKECLSRFAVNCLDDREACDCGKCFNCTGKDIFPGMTLSFEAQEKAAQFINSSLRTILPRKRWPEGGMISEKLEQGICLSRYGDSGYGELVKKGKYPGPGKTKRFDDRLVERAAEVLEPLIREQHIRHITCVPSLRSDLVPDFTRRLAARTRLSFVELLEKTPAPQQKEMENSAHQCANARNSFAVKVVNVPEKVILVDDVVDSGWTLTVCGCKIMEQGCQAVYPFALADSSQEES